MIESISMSLPVQQTGSKSNTERYQDAKQSIPEKRDKYIPGEEDPPTGIYSVSEDENGGLNISVDSDEKTAPAKDSDSEDNTVTANTDKVDREIKKLREKEKRIQRELRTADEKTAEKLKRELEQVSAELAEKDNDQYRRQHTEFSQ